MSLIICFKCQFFKSITYQFTSIIYDLSEHIAETYLSVNKFISCIKYIFQAARMRFKIDYELYSYLSLPQG